VTSAIGGAIVMVAVGAHVCYSNRSKAAVVLA